MLGRELPTRSHGQRRRLWIGADALESGAARGVGGGETRRALVIDSTQIIEALKDFGTLFEILSDDLTDAFTNALKGAAEDNDKESQRARRNAARAMFALIDGVTYGMKRLAYETDQGWGLNTFSPAESAALQERAYRLTESGEVKTIPLRPGVVPNIRFAFNAFARVFRSGLALDTYGEDWSRFKRTIQIRHRLTHPKGAPQLSVTVEELAELVQVTGWFDRTVRATLQGAFERVSRGQSSPPPITGSADTAGAEEHG